MVIEVAVLPPTSLRRAGACELSAKHLADLRQSGLTDETIALAGLFTETDGHENAMRLNWRGNADLGPCLTVPYPDPKSSEPIFYRVKPDKPRPDKAKPGRFHKYEQPKTTPSAPYLPPRGLIDGRLRDWEQPLYFTEGEKKALLLDQLGYAVVGAAGVNNFHDTALKKKTGRWALHPLIVEHATLAGRQCVICFDGDAEAKKEVVLAARQLCALLTRAGVHSVVFATPPPGDDQPKGIDDFFFSRELACEDGAEAVAEVFSRASPIEPLALAEPEAPKDAVPDPFADWRPMAERGTSWLDVEPPPRRWLLRRNGKAAFARAIAVLLCSPGGRGKTMSLVQLAVSVATGRPWLGTYDVIEPGRVVLALAEEPEDEIRRRIYWASRALDLSDRERRDAERRIIPLGLQGMDVSLVHMSERGRVTTSAAHASLLARLATEEHACVILDPLSRFAPDVESSNGAATIAIQALERLTHGPGSPAVFVAHHTSKWSRREGNKGESAAARGVTGLVDAVRLVASLEGSGVDDIALVVSKSNYAPHGDSVPLVRDEISGILRPPTSCESDQRKVESAGKADELRAAIVSILTASPGLGAGALRDAVKGAGLATRGTAVDVAAAALVAEGVLSDTGGKSRHRFEVHRG